MGQGASSTSHGENALLRSTIASAGINDLATINTDDENFSHRSQRRRRSHSPDVDTAELSRSGRLRRRLSRLVPTSLSTASLSSTACQAPSARHNLPSTQEEGDAGLSLNDGIDTQRPPVRYRHSTQPGATLRSPEFRGRPYSTSTSISRQAAAANLARGSPSFSPASDNPGLGPWPRQGGRQTSLTRPASLDNGYEYVARNRGSSQPQPLPQTSPTEEAQRTTRDTMRTSRLSRMRRSITADTLATAYNSSIASNSTETLADWDTHRLRRPAMNRNFSLPSVVSLDYGSDIDAPVASTSTSMRSPIDQSLGDFASLDSSESPTRARPGEDQAAVLSRLLSVAAAATAASLVGSSDQALTEAQDVAGDSVDGSFESFLRALQNGRLAAALRNGGNELGEPASEPGTVDPSGSDGSIAPLNFFRMFRFGSGTQPIPGNSEERAERMIPVIIVGIRSVTPNDGLIHDGRPTPPFFDALANLPATNGGDPIDASRVLPRPLASRRTADSSGNRRHQNSLHLDTDVHSPSTLDLPPIGGLPASSLPPSPDRATQRRSFSPGSLTSPLPSLFSSMRSRRNSVGTAPSGMDTSFPRSPAESSGSNRDSASWTRPHAPRTEHNPRAEQHTERRSDRPRSAHFSTERPGRSRLSSQPRTGASRSPSEGTRSWIIYVLGGSYPENHPILTTPSLFTDTPTYEDMMLLSSLLGPAKPPVATQEDVESAGGVLEVYLNSDGLVSAEGQIGVNDGDRCLVCLCDFERGEKVRQLTKCEHLFHRECIDEWLTTGRNSCPLCRGQGVKETPKAEPAEGAPLLADGEGGGPPPVPA